MPRHHAGAAPLTLEAMSDAAAQALQQELRQLDPGLRVDWVANTGSTNADLLQWARSAADGLGPRLLLADQQSAGRGRQGRSWQAEPGASLLLSLAWPLPPRCAVLGLSLAVGVWLAESLHTLGAAAVGLKWPNDLLLGADKLGGVLIELADTPAARWAVIGIGINLQPPNGVECASGLDSCLPGCTRAALLRALAPALLDGLRRWPQDGFAACVQRWNALHAWQGQSVRLLDGGVEQAQGIARGVDCDGCLLLDCASGLRRIASGDLSLRRDA